MISFDHLENDIASRPEFHGFVEIQTDLGDAQMVYYASRRQSVLRHPNLESRIKQFQDFATVGGRVSLYKLDTGVARVAARFNWAQTSELNRPFREFGFPGLISRLYDMNVVGVLLLQTSELVSQVFIGGARVLHFAVLSRQTGASYPVDFGSLGPHLPPHDTQVVLYATENAAQLMQLTKPSPTPGVDQGLLEDGGNVINVEDTRAVLAAWSTLLRRVEAAVDTPNRKVFARAWRAACANLTAEHPILDPFAEELTWRDGELRLETEQSVNITNALLAAFKAMLNGLDVPAAKLMAVVRLEELIARFPQAGLDRLALGGTRQ